MKSFFSALHADLASAPWTIEKQVTRQVLGCLVHCHCRMGEKFRLKIDRCYSGLYISITDNDINDNDNNMWPDFFCQPRVLRLISAQTQSQALQNQKWNLSAHLPSKPVQDGTPDHLFSCLVVNHLTLMQRGLRKVTQQVGYYSSNKLRSYSL